MAVMRSGLRVPGWGCPAAFWGRCRQERETLLRPQLKLWNLQNHCDKQRQKMDIKDSALGNSIRNST